ncbi:MAG: hypothetical protein QOH32_1603 [Bradyrhizobium sp.]|jgi:uncharacterized protein with HEPN domain|nr:hypothetical protein [Bradyrhizobium sp.]
MRDEIRNLSMELEGLSFDTYRESYSLRRITERAIQIISEAARALPEELRARYPAAPWADIVAIGNPLRHEYNHIDDRVLWETATVDLPALQPVILRMLNEFED